LSCSEEKVVATVNFRGDKNLDNIVARRKETKTNTGKLGGR